MMRVFFYQYLYSESIRFSGSYKRRLQVTIILYSN